MSSGITKDSLLRYLDLIHADLARHLFCLSEDWIRLSATRSEEATRELLVGLAGRVREQSEVIAEPTLRHKGLLASDMLSETPLPASPSELTLETSGRWFEEVPAPSRATGGLAIASSKRMSGSVVDYVFKVRRPAMRLNVSEFLAGIQITQGRYAADVLPEFKEWVRSLDLRKLSALEGKTWEANDGDSWATIYITCIQSATSPLAELERLRALDRHLPARSHYVCIADPEDSKFFADQGYGSIVYPLGEIRGSVLETEETRTRGIEEPKDQRFSFGEFECRVVVED